MATKLKNMVITKVALVDEGACSAAHINLFKRKENEIMNFEEIVKSLTPEQQAIVKAKVDADAAELAKACKEMKKAEDEKKKAEEDLKKESDTFAAFKEEAKKKEEEKEVAKSKEQTEEELMKSASPAVQAMFSKMKAQAQAAETIAKKLAEDAVNAEALAKAKTLKNVPASEDELVNLYKSLSGNAATSKIVFDILEKAHAAVESGDLLKSKGSNQESTALTGNADQVWGEIEKAAEPLAKSRNITVEAAIDEVLKSNKDLSTRYTNALRQG